MFNTAIGPGPEPVPPTC